ncbi:MAG TPA: HAMP domain-containing sensor histidine kinase, partial [Pseudomonadales bacterium]|nr:HAMP domain-containing sensor histidine kinase [Pseudomonadales bacterium]
YVTKPFDAEEVITRVENHLKIHNLHVQLEENYRQLQELEELRDGLVNMVIHDMRSPLLVIRSALGLLLHNLGDQMDRESKEDINDALASANTLTTMINNLLDISRLEDGKMVLKIEKCDVKEIVDSVVKDLSTLSKAHAVTTVCRTDNPSAYCDEEVVRRIITNLLGNALKFTPRGGEICVSVKEGKDRLEVSVQDNGPGISSDYHEKIFKKFGQSGNKTQGRFESSGLGLTFCLLASESLGGVMDVDSKVGEGSRFWFTLPTNAAAQ